MQRYISPKYITCGFFLRASSSKTTVTAISLIHHRHTNTPTNFPPDPRTISQILQCLQLVIISNEFHRLQFRFQFVRVAEESQGLRFIGIPNMGSYPRYTPHVAVHTWDQLLLLNSLEASPSQIVSSTNFSSLKDVCILPPSIFSLRGVPPLYVCSITLPWISQLLSGSTSTSL